MESSARQLMHRRRSQLNYLDSSADFILVSRTCSGRYARLTTRIRIAIWAQSVGNHGFERTETSLSGSIGGLQDSLPHRMSLSRTTPYAPASYQEVDDKHLTYRANRTSL